MVLTTMTSPKIVRKAKDANMKMLLGDAPRPDQPNDAESPEKPRRAPRSHQFPPQLRLAVSTMTAPLGERRPS